MNLQHFLMRSIPTPTHEEFFVSDPFPLDDEEIAEYDPLVGRFSSGCAMARRKMDACSVDR